MLADSNGAYYYGDPYQSAATGGAPNWYGGYDYNLTCCTKSKLMAAKDSLDKDKVPINYLQLDDWCTFPPVASNTVYKAGSLADIDAC